MQPNSHRGNGDRTRTVVRIVGVYNIHETSIRPVVVSRCGPVESELIITATSKNKILSVHSSPTMRVSASLV